MTLTNFKWKIKNSIKIKIKTGDKADGTGVSCFEHPLLYMNSTSKGRSARKITKIFDKTCSVSDTNDIMGIPIVMWYQGF